MKVDEWFAVLILSLQCLCLSAFVLTRSVRFPGHWWQLSMEPKDANSSRDKKGCQSRKEFPWKGLLTTVAIPTTIHTAPETRSSARPKPQDQEFKYQSHDRLPWLPQRHRTWQWCGNNVHYIALGNNSHQRHKPALLFLHGWGSHAYHFRYNLPILARHYRVFAMDLLGFGLSDKPLIDYSAELWRDQTEAFSRQVIRSPVILVGNSLGALITLYTCTLDNLQQSQFIRGCVLMNVAGGFSKSLRTRALRGPLPLLVQRLLEALQRFVFFLSFGYVRNPAHIAQVLHSVYPVHPKQVDDELVQAIHFPSLDPNAAEIYYRVSVAAGSNRQVFVDELLPRVQCPLLLCWGVRDPWYGPTVADRIQSLHPSSQRVNIEAGHCPHDEAPNETNQAILAFARQLCKE